ncbi:MAG: hypothetical protein CK424_06845 [Legionella sp.]|nr:MAG: hypothetical protein CK424_06845 [Legionella sp.]
MKRSIKLLFMSFLLSIYSFSYADCPSVDPASPGFCDAFKASSACYCASYNTLPKGKCANMTLIYKMMVASLGSLQRACDWQRNTTAQECIDDWNCYHYGGMTSTGQLCSGSGHACV